MSRTSPRPHRGWLLLLAILWASPAWAQQILIDKPVRAGALTLFPDLNDETVFYYVPDKPVLATDASGRPQFSFLRYVENVRSGADQPDAREGDGGGIVHAVVSLSVTPEQLRDAQQALQRIKPGARIQGPVIFRSGKFGLVSSFKDPAGKLTTQVVGLGNAPLLDGEKAAVSIQLTRTGAKILWESFQTPTPDISFTFEMDVEGYRAPQRALIEANFDQIYQHQAFSAGVATKFLAGEIKTAFDDLQRQGAIKVTEVGSDDKMDALITTAYNKIADLMFDPIGGTGTPSLDSLTAGAGGQSLLDRASALYAKNRAEADAANAKILAEDPGTAGGAGKDTTAAAKDGPHVAATAREQGITPPTDRDTSAAGRLSNDEATARERERAAQRQSAPPIAIVAAYELKKVHQRGIFRIDLNKYTTDRLTLRFDENIGDLRGLFADAEHFRQVNLDDPLFRQREIAVFVDGLNAKDFGNYINFVVVHMRKKHSGGEVTDDEVRIDRNNFNAQGNAFKLLYGWNGDTDRQRWMEYEYQPVWSFFGGQQVESPWRASSAGALDLAPPYQRRLVDLQAEPKAIADAGVRSITVKIYYRLADTEQVKQVTLNVSKNQLADKIEFMTPVDAPDYEYEITWRLTGNRTLSSGRQKASDDVLFVDEVKAGAGEAR